MSFVLVSWMYIDLYLYVCMICVSEEWLLGGNIFYVVTLVVHGNCVEISYLFAYTCNQFCLYFLF